MLAPGEASESSGAGGLDFLEVLLTSWKAERRGRYLKLLQLYDAEQADISADASSHLRGATCLRLKYDIEVDFAACKQHVQASQ